MKFARGAVCLSFFLSGLAALVYEVLWVRLISLFCGNTTLAVSAVLAAFMAGLALGSWLGGKAADKIPPSRLLLAYALLELGIGALGALSGPIIAAMRALILPLGLVSASPAAQSLAYFSASFAALILPTTLMGATLPTLTRWAGTPEAESDRPLALLYGLNTLGAVVGALLAGFVLIASLGMSRSLLLAAAANLLCSATAFALWAGSSPEAPQPGSPPAGAAARAPAAISLVLFVAGAAAMAAQAAWTRAFALVLGSSTYSFTLMLTTFLLGLAAGSEAFAAMRRRRRPGVFGLGLLLAAISALVFAGLPLFNYLPYGVMRVVASPDQGLLRLHLFQFLLCATVMALPTFLMGAVLPWAVAVCAPQGDRIASETGTAYASNTAGAILGSSAAGLVLLPVFGAERTLSFAAWLYAAAAAFAVARGELPGPRRSAWVASILIAALCADVLRPAWNPRILSSGMFLYAGKYAKAADYGEFVEDLIREEHRVLYSKDGRVSTVAVFEDPTGERFLRINGKTDASLSGDADTQLFNGYLPWVFHRPGPKRALVIGLGSGTTVAAVAADPGIRRIDVVEIEPAVAEAAGFFEIGNRRALEDPRVRLARADARQYLESGDRRFDLISSEPSNPWIAGVANLYTVEAFESAKRALEEDGVFCQWFHSYYMSADDFKLIVRTFAAVFPNVALSTNGTLDFFLLGSKRPWKLDLAELRGRFRDNATLRRDLARVDIPLDDPLAFVEFTHVLRDAEARAFAGPGPVNRDDAPLLEFSAPRNIRRGEPQKIIADLRQSRRSLIPAGLEGFASTSKEQGLIQAVQGEILLTTDATAEEAEVSLRKAALADPSSPRIETDLGRLDEMLRRPRDAERRYRRAAALDPRYAPARVRLGVLLVGEKRSKEGLPQLERALELLPAEPLATQYLALAYLEQGRAAQALKIVRAAFGRPIVDPRIRENLAQASRLAEQAVEKK